MRWDKNEMFVELDARIQHERKLREIAVAGVEKLLLEVKRMIDDKKDDDPAPGPEPAEKPRDEMLYDLMANASRSDAREDEMLGEIMRFLVNADKVGFAMVYGAMKSAKAAQEERFRERLKERYLRREKSS